MNTNEISGKRQLEFLADFDYIREAGTAGEEKAAERIQKTLDSFGVESHLEEFSFDTFQIKKAKLKVTEPYTKEYTVTGYGRCGNTAEDGLEAPFAYAENGDDISLAYVSGKWIWFHVHTLCQRICREQRKKKQEEKLSIMITGFLA